MNKKDRITEAEMKVDELYSEYERINTAYHIATANLAYAKKSEYEIGDRVCVYEASGNHGRGSDFVGSGEVVELIRYGGWYKVKLDSGEIRTFDRDFVSKIDMRKL